MTDNGDWVELGSDLPLYDSRVKLQQLQDAVAYAVNVPLRVIELDELENLPRHLAELAGKLDASAQEGTDDAGHQDPHIQRDTLVNNPAKFLRVVNHSVAFVESVFRDASSKVLEQGFADDVTELDDWIDNYADQRKPDLKRTLFSPVFRRLITQLVQPCERLVFGTLMANAHPIHLFFRQNSRWRFFELAWLYRNLVHGSREPRLLQAPFGLETWVSQVEPLGYSEASNQILAGPIFQASRQFGHEAFHREHAQVLIVFFRLFHCTIMGKSPTPSWQHMLAVAHARRPEFRAGIAGRAKQASRGLSTALSAQVNTESLPLSAGDLGLIAAACARSASEDPQPEPIRVPLLKAADGHQPGLVVVRNVGGECRAQVAKCEASAVDCAASSMSDALCDYLSGTADRRQLYTANRLFMYHTWVQERLRAHTDSGLKKSDQYKFVATSTARLLRADSCSIFQYKADSAALLLQSYHSELDIDEARVTRYADDMESAAHDPAARDQSICYRAVERRRSCFSPPDKFLSVSYLVPDEPDQTHREMRSLIATPILYNKRALGVIEYTGYSQSQFEWGYRQLAERIATLFAPYMFEQRLLVTMHGIVGKVFDWLRQGSSAETDDSFSERICPLLCDIFLCDGASIWRRNEERHDVYELAGSNARDVRDSQEKLGFRLDNTTHSDANVVNRHMHERFEGPESFSISWSNEVCTLRAASGLTFSATPQFAAFARQASLRRVGVFVIPDSPSPAGGDSARAPYPKGTVSLYSRSNVGFDSGWAGVTQFIGDYLRLVLQAVEDRREAHLAWAAELHHELRRDALVVRERSRRLIEVSQRVIRLERQAAGGRASDAAGRAELDKQRVTLDSVRSELNDESSNILKRLDSADDIIRGGPNARLLLLDPTPEPKTLDAYEATRRDSVAVDRNLNDAVRDTAQLRHVALRAKGLWPTYARELRGRTIRVHESNWRTIVDNLVDNAAKYSTPNTAVSFMLEEFGDFFVLVVRNQAAPLRATDSARLFQRGVRGSNAVGSGIDGDGLGLYIAQHVANLYGMSIRHKQRPCRVEGQVYHDFRITIPRDLTGRA